MPRLLLLFALTGLLGSALELIEPARAEAAHAARCGDLPLRPTAQDVIAAGRPWVGHPGRVLIDVRARRGDYPALIATRCHAWTAELIRLNGGPLHVGQRLRVPVVLSALAKHAPPTKPRPHGRPHIVAKPLVRRALLKAARRHDVPRSLVLAIAWQESGWQQHVRSSKGAVGTMQVMPGTGRWLSTYVGKRLHLRDLHDNVEAGVVLLKVLRRQTTDRRAIAAYYQGLGAVQKHGFYRDTLRYVKSVRALQKRFEKGWNPLR
ncbi:MAG TPA: lytic transglycosylase domain-containing protein [Marmoricola sp.]|nr:lytic transglycosylase domain-containing protein [Marmoricola sp.]